MGQWALSEPLGRGGMGRVFLASNSTNEVAAIKIVERNPNTAGSVDREVGTFRELATEKWVDGERIVRLLEVIGDGESYNPPSSQTPFREIAMVMVPMTPITLSNLVGSSNGGAKGMTIDAARVLRDAFLGALHGDLKPPNIGVIGTPPRAVLLDIGHATHLKSGSTLHPTPGRGGTLDYIAPEREMECYNHAVDVWSLGVIAFELTYGR